MSRVGKKPIQVPEGVKVEVNGENIKVSGPKGELNLNLHQDVAVELKGNEIIVSPQKKDVSKKAKSLWGSYRAIISNMVEGTSRGFEKKLEIEGVGHKASVDGDNLVLSVGFVHPVKIKKPERINFSVEKNVITVSGISKEEVGQIASIIRKAKKAEPYKGKGIKYQGEKIRRKEGKKVVSAKK